MALEIKHAHQTAIPDDPTYDVGSDEWNASHTLTGVLPEANGGTGATSLAAANAAGGIPDGSITNAKFRDSVSLSVVGRAASTAGDVADIRADVDGEILRRSGTTVDFGTIATAGIGDDQITNAKLADMAQATVKGRASGAGTGDPTDLTATQVRAIINVEDGADVTDAANVNTAGAVMEADFDANTILAATTDNTPTARTIAENDIVGRLPSGAIGGIADGDLTEELTPAAGDFLLGWVGGLLRKIDVGDLPTGSGGLGDNLGDHIADQDLNMDTNNIVNGGVIKLIEQADADADTAGSGQIWVDTATPNVLMFTDDAGNDFRVNYTAGIGNDNLLLAKNTPMSGEFARFTAAGIEGRTTLESLGDLTILNGANYHVDLTIASGAITLPAVYASPLFVRLDTEGAAATDDLDTITGSPGVAGRVVVISSLSPARDPTIKTGTGNITLLSGDFTVFSANHNITLMQMTSGAWVELSRNVPAAVTPADDSITNAKLANMAQATIKGRASAAGTGDPADLTPAQAGAVIGQFPTRAAAQAFNPTTAPDFIRTAGYTTAGDGGGGLYMKVAVEPTHIGKIQSADGTWWELADPIINIIQFGALPNTSANAAPAIQGAIDYIKAKTTPTGLGYGGTIRIPRGDYSVQGLVEMAVTGDIFQPIKFEGDGAYIGPASTRLIWQPATSLPLGLSIKSGQQIYFEGIEFVCGSSNVGTLVQVDAQDSPVFSSFHIWFHSCSFRNFSGGNPSGQMLRLVNVAGMKFSHCWLGGDNNKIKLGDNLPAAEGAGTCGTCLFEQCQIYMDVEIGNTTHLTFLNCIFARPNNFPVRIYPAATNFVRQNHTTIIGCSQVSTTIETTSNTFWTQGTNSIGLVAFNNRFNGYKTTFEINGKGQALLTGNQYTPPPGISSCIGINVGATATDVNVGNEDFSALVAAGHIGLRYNSATWINNTLIGSQYITGLARANSIELGHNTDTTITRVSPGVIAVEGKPILTQVQYKALGTIADDGAASFALSPAPNAVMVMLVSNTIGGIKGFYKARILSSQNTENHDLTGATFGFINNPLTGTTGPDGQFNLGVDTSGVLYFENRTGSAKVISAYVWPL